MLFVLLQTAPVEPKAPLEPPMMDLLIQNGTVVTMDADMRIIDGGAIAIKGDSIAAIFNPSEPLPAAKRILDATDHIVIPGLINTHGHVPMVLLRGIADDLKLMDWLEKYIFPTEAKSVTREFVYWGSLLACLEMARSGTTTFVDMYYFEEEIARAAERAGLRSVLGQTIIGIPAPDYKSPDDALAGAESFIERYKDHPLVVPSIAPHALYTTPFEVIQRAFKIAKKHDVPFQIHAVEAKEEDRLVQDKLGKKTIEALDDAGLLGPRVLLAHGVWLSDEDIRRVAQSGAGISHNPESNMKTASGVARVPELLEAGIPVGLGTDGPASNNNLDLFEEMDTAAKLHKLVQDDPTVLPAREVFAMATKGGARALGMEDEIGSIEIGKRADLALIDMRQPELTPLYDVYSQLVYATKGAQVDTVIVNGRIVLEDRQMRTLDAAEVLKQARRIQAQITNFLKSDSRN
jgi:5-methylthioadenosine/S-adenosylhomocysteine deaminase